jgi:hypothetical protein
MDESTKQKAVLSFALAAAAIAMVIYLLKITI